MTSMIIKVNHFPFNEYFFISKIKYLDSVGKQIKGDNIKIKEKRKETLLESLRIA